MRLFKTKSFIRFARRERISDASLREAVQRAERGLVDAELGGGLIKQRVARPGQGRSGGYRVLLAYRVNTLSVFLHDFAKNERDNIDGDELATSPEDGFKPTQQRSRERLRTVWYRRSSMAKKKTASRLAKAMLETATDMHNSGVLGQATYDKITMRHLGSNVPKAMPVTAAQIRESRTRQYELGGIRPTFEPDGRLCVAAGTGDQATDRRCARAFEHYQAQRYGSHLVTELATKRFRG